MPPAPPAGNKGTKRGQDGNPKGYTDAELKSQTLQYFRNVAKQKKASQAEKDEAEVALHTFAHIGVQEKVEFARSFFNNKGNKNFGFVKEYTERLTNTKSTTETCQENYYTRIYT